MIDITFYYKGKNDSGVLNFIGYELLGHAGFAEYGKDIVCAAVSTLSLNTANAINELTDNKVIITYKDDGYLKLIAKDGFDSKGDLLMQTFHLGISNTYEDYKNELNENEFINIKFEEV